MPSRGQSIVLTYIAWDTNANVGKTGDVANHTLRWIKDGTSAAPTNSPSEIDATNAPGAYKLTLTTAECTCDTGTLVGKSSTANVSIIPVAIAFEQLPTVAAGVTNGLPTVDSSGRVKSNIEAIDGSVTSSNDATLYLKQLNIVNSTGNAIHSVSTGADGHGIYAKGSTKDAVGILAMGGFSDGTSGTGFAAVGGGLPIGTFGTGHGILSYGAASGSGIFAYGPNGIVANGSNNGDRNDFVGDIAGNVLGSIGSISTVRPKKNTGLDNFMFPMFDATTKSPKAGLTVTAERSIDGNSFSPCSSSVAELSNGIYRISLSAEDMNGGKIMFRFFATGADDQLVEIITQD